MADIMNRVLKILLFNCIVLLAYVSDTNEFITSAGVPYYNTNGTWKPWQQKTETIRKPRTLRLPIQHPPSFQTRHFPQKRSFLPKQRTFGFGRGNTFGRSQGSSLSKTSGPKNFGYSRSKTPVLLGSSPQGSVLSKSGAPVSQTPSNSLSNPVPGWKNSRFGNSYPGQSIQREPEVSKSVTEDEEDIEQAGKNMATISEEDDYDHDDDNQDNDNDFENEGEEEKDEYDNELQTTGTADESETNNPVENTLLMDDDPCADTPCENGGTCKRGDGGTYFCACPLGFHGKTCGEEEGDACEMNPCSNGGTCIRDITEGLSGFHCACPFGKRGKYCDEVVEECESVTCTSRGDCIATADGFLCVCRDGFGGRMCEIRNENISQSMKGRIILTEKDVHAGEVAAAVVMTIVVVVLFCLAIHCCRVNNKRAILKKRYKSYLASGLVPRHPPPDWCDVSNRLCLNFFCCGGGGDDEEMETITSTIQLDEDKEEMLDRLLNSKISLTNAGLKRTGSRTLGNSAVKISSSNLNRQATRRPSEQPVQSRTSLQRMPFLDQQPANLTRHRSVPYVNSRRASQGRRASVDPSWLGQRRSSSVSPRRGSLDQQGISQKERGSIDHSVLNQRRVSADQKRGSLGPHASSHGSAFQKRGSVDPSSLYQRRSSEGHSMGSLHPNVGSNVRLLETESEIQPNIEKRFDGQRRVSLDPNFSTQKTYSRRSSVDPSWFSQRRVSVDHRRGSVGPNVWSNLKKHVSEGRASKDQPWLKQRGASDDPRRHSLNTNGFSYHMQSQDNLGQRKSSEHRQSASQDRYSEGYISPSDRRSSLPNESRRLSPRMTRLLSKYEDDAGRISDTFDEVENPREEDDTMEGNDSVFEKETEDSSEDSDDTSSDDADTDSSEDRRIQETKRQNIDKKAWTSQDSAFRRHSTNQENMPEFEFPSPPPNERRTSYPEYGLPSPRNERRTSYPEYGLPSPRNERRTSYHEYGIPAPPNERRTSYPEYSLPSPSNERRTSYPEYGLPSPPNERRTSYPEYSLPSSPNERRTSYPEYAIPALPNERRTSYPENGLPSPPNERRTSYPDYELPPPPSNERRTSYPDYELPSPPPNERRTSYPEYGFPSPPRVDSSYSYPDFAPDSPPPPDDVSFNARIQERNRYQRSATNLPYEYKAVENHEHRRSHAEFRSRSPLDPALSSSATKDNNNSQARLYRSHEMGSNKNISKLKTVKTSPAQCGPVGNIATTTPVDPSLTNINIYASSLDSFRASPVANTVRNENKPAASYGHNVADKTSAVDVNAVEISPVPLSRDVFHSTASCSGTGDVLLFQDTSDAMYPNLAKEASDSFLASFNDSSTCVNRSSLDVGNSVDETLIFQSPSKQRRNGVGCTPDQRRRTENEHGIASIELKVQDDNHDDENEALEQGDLLWELDDRNNGKVLEHVETQTELGHPWSPEEAGSFHIELGRGSATPSAVKVVEFAVVNRKSARKEYETGRNNNSLTECSSPQSVQVTVLSPEQVQCLHADNNSGLDERVSSTDLNGIIADEDRNGESLNKVNKIKEHFEELAHRENFNTSASCDPGPKKKLSNSEVKVDIDADIDSLMSHLLADTGKQ